MNTEILTERRSVNFFDTNKQITPETFKEIMDLASMAPSAFNLQPWRVIAVNTQAEKDKLLPLTWNQPKTSEASYTLIIVGDRAGYEKDAKIWAEIQKSAGEETTNMLKDMSNQLYSSSEEMKIRFTESNCSLFIMSIMYAAQALGVNSHTMSGVDYAGIKKQYELKDSEEVVLLLSLGYHDTTKELYPRGYRKQGEELYTVI